MASGLVRESEKTWFSGLSDKGTCTLVQIWGFRGCLTKVPVLESRYGQVILHYFVILPEVFIEHNRLIVA